jgi:hypothetical protein
LAPFAPLRILANVFVPLSGVLGAYKELVTVRRKQRDLKRDYNISLMSARSFYQLAVPFLQKIGVDQECHKKAVADLGGLISSATNMAFSIEMYLKTLRLMSGLSVPQTHDLWVLFKHLPEQLKNALSNQYEHLKSLSPPEAIQALQILMTPTEKQNLKDDFDKNDEKRRLDNSLKGVIKRNKSAFENWRYIYEQEEMDRAYTLHYDYVCLSLIVKSFETIIQPQTTKRA